MKKFLLISILFTLAFPLIAQYFGKNKIQPQKIDWNNIQTMHFDIYYPARDDDFGKIVALCAEEAYYYIREDFRTPVKQRIPIIFYSTHQEFESTNVIPNLLSEGVGGFTESMNNRVVMPFSGSYREMEQTLIHEMTHAYVNELSRGRIGNTGRRSLPFWLSEGLPEFISINGKRTYNNMFIIDLVLNNNLINLEEVGGYYAYREGESFLNFIEQEYGRDKVMDIFYSARSDTQNAMMKRIFNVPFLELQQRWENSLKRRYFAMYNDYRVPYEVYERRTDSQKDGSSMNVAPRYAPEGLRYAWFANRKLTDGIWFADRSDLGNDRELIRSAVTGELEEFHFKRNNLSWFPDGKRIAFAANTSFGDRIQILDVNKEHIAKSVSFDSINVVYELDVSPDGKKIVFNGIKGTSTDIFIYDLEQETLQQLTQDKYYDGAPRWSSDGKHIVFYSERLPLQSRENLHIFDKSVRNIYYCDLESNEFYQVTDSASDNYNPVWSADGSKILYISDEDMITNIRIIDLKNAREAQVTDVLCGVLNFDLSRNDEYILLSCFYNGAWDLFQKTAPLDSLQWQDSHLPQKVKLADDFWERYDIERIRYFGKTNLAFKKPASHQNIDPELAEMYDIKIDYGPDTTIVEENRRIDRRPTEENEPEIIPYKLKWKIDNFWGGLAYNSTGTYALLNIWASDILGNHSLYSSFNVSGEIESSSFSFQYLDLTRRDDYGGGVFYLNDETLYRNANDDYFRARDRQYGFYGIMLHPFDKYWRLETQLAVLRHQTFWDWWDKYNGDWIEGWQPDENDYLVAPKLSIVHDNTLYGYVGPIAGGKQYLSLQHSFSTKKDYNMIYADLRNYKFFAKRYSWANRLIAAWTDSDEFTGFELTGFNGVRGFNDNDLDGKRKFLFSTELRYPLIDNLTLAFPFPIRMSGVRGSVFIDLGAVWDEEKDFVFWNYAQLKDARMGIGFGPRFNLGFFILKFDIAWQTDLVNSSKPNYYFWLMEDF
ncbi:MAG: BamA/TamA family outer membrane protein [Candidatus Cloacimonetes bacterium]|nr:BamA/TamA family outer membrane protein [Candidatus Cloacimonadota bacterium]